VSNECKCGFSPEFPSCNGTHKIVQKVREQIASDIEAIEIGSTNGLGIRMLAASVARGKSIIVHTKRKDKSE
jgi:hypothetical protein